MTWRVIDAAPVNNGAAVEYIVSDGEGGYRRRTLAAGELAVLGQKGPLRFDGEPGLAAARMAAIQHERRTE